MFYHVTITAKSRLMDPAVKVDLSDAQVRERVVKPWKQGTDIFLAGRSISPTDVHELTIHRTDQPSSAYAAHARQQRREGAALPVSDDWYVAQMGDDVTDDFITGPAGSAAQTERARMPSQSANLQQAASPAPLRTKPVEITKLRQQLDQQQHNILNAIWHHYLENGQWISTRLAHHRFGKDVVRRELAQLGGDIVFAAGWSGEARYQLTFPGVLLTDQGEDGERLLVRYVEYLRDRFQQDPEVKQVISGEVETALGLTERQSRLLAKLIELGNFWGRSAGFSYPWTAGVPDDIDDLPSIADLQAYVQSRSAKDFDPSVPIDENERAAYLQAHRFGVPHTALIAKPGTTDVDTVFIREHPLFGPMPTATDDRLCFVLMPFDTAFDEVWQDGIRKVVKQADLQCLRADDLYGPGSIVRDIWENIVKARVLLADLTGKNPNVFYELGLAHAIGKQVILLTQDIGDVPFDLRHLRIVEYGTTGRGLEKLRKDLLTNLLAVVQPQA